MSFELSSFTKSLFICESSSAVARFDVSEFVQPINNENRFAKSQKAINKIAFFILKFDLLIKKYCRDAIFCVSTIAPKN